MKTEILITLSALALATTSIASAQDEHHESKPLYTCPMHPEIVRSEPGQCPKCGMTLVPLKENGKRRTSNPPSHGSGVTGADHPMPKSEHATHNANGMAVPEHHDGEHAEH